MELKMMDAVDRKNGCHNRPPHLDNQVLIVPSFPSYHRMLIPNRFKKDCQYTLTDLGQADPGCLGCSWRLNLE